jgi:hypothetical protein
MTRPCGTLFTLCCLVAAPLLAQTTTQPEIGGNTCSSGTLGAPQASGGGPETYAFTITGREVTAAGNFTNAIEGTGTITFDGESVVDALLVTDNPTAAATPMTWAGTYSMQANCNGVITITGGPTLNIVPYGTGPSGTAPTFLVTGNDANFTYFGSGNSQPTATCSTSTFAGVYSLNGTGYSISSGVVNGAATLAGVMEVDGLGNIILNTNQGNLTGTYSLSSNCLGMATLPGGSKGNYTMSFSATGANSTGVTDLDVTLAQAGHLMISGAGHYLYAAPPATETSSPGATLFKTDVPTEVLAKLLSAVSDGRGL